MWDRVIHPRFFGVSNFSIIFGSDGSFPFLCKDHLDPQGIPLNLALLQYFKKKNIFRRLFQHTVLKTTHPFKRNPGSQQAMCCFSRFPIRVGVGDFELTHVQPLEVGVTPPFLNFSGLPFWMIKKNINGIKTNGGERLDFQGLTCSIIQLF